jgi:hypothetical protein
METKNKNDDPTNIIYNREKLFKALKRQGFRVIKFNENIENLLEAQKKNDEIPKFTIDLTLWLYD